MILSKQMMQQIAGELENTIHRPIHITDTEGRIIAAKDTGRIGTIHQASLRLLSKGLPQLDIFKDEEWNGAQQGSSLPITFCGETAGVVSISGPPEEVGDLGAIIKKMTEILMEEAYQQEQRLLFDNARSTFLYRWLLEEHRSPESLEQLEYDGNLLGIDSRLSRIAAVMEPCPNEGTSFDALFDQELHTGLKAIVAQITSAQSSHLFLTIGGRLLLLCQGQHVSAAEILCKEISDMFQERFHLPLAIGIGSCGTCREEIIRSYREAEKACYLSYHTKNNEIRHFPGSDVLPLLRELSDETKNRYINQIFPECPKQELRQWMLMLRVFFDANGSIQKTSDQLFIHKNTTQYRLNKLKQLTGYDPRIYKEAFSLYAALTIYEYHQPS